LADWALARSEPFGDTAICYWDCLANFTFVHKFVPARYAGIAGLLILIDPSLLARLLWFRLMYRWHFFLMGMNAVFENRKPWLTLAVLLYF
jgi:hypothetical protein